MIDFNTEPYYDDFDADNKFYRILFRPGYPVQARELTQLQTIIQQQIKNHGDNIFKQGSMIVPGDMVIDTQYAYVKLQTTYSGNAVNAYIQSLIGTTVTGTTSGVKAKVVYAAQSVSTESTPAPVLYVRYLSSGTDTTTKVFANAETLTSSDGIHSVLVATSAATGMGSAAIINKGVYYINGIFAVVEPQTILLDKYTNTPSYRVGLTVNESIKTSDDAGYEMLLDNAQNSPNYAAPGAHRYYIQLDLAKVAIDATTDTNFIELSRVVNGIVTKETKNTEYAVIEDTMARRTFDESGNYTVKDFAIDVREHRSNNRGAWASGTAYIIGDVVTNGGNTYVARNTISGNSANAPVHTSGVTALADGIQWEYNLTPYYNRGIYTVAQGGDESKVAIGLEPGKAYVQGYEISKIATEYLSVPKARTYSSVTNASVPAVVGNYVLVTNIHGMPAFDTFKVVSLYDTMTTSAGRGSSAGTLIGTARIRGVEWANGTRDNNGVFKLFLFDVKMNTGYDFNRDVKSFFYNAGSTALNFTADINPVLTQLTGSISIPTAGIAVTGIGTSFTTTLTTADYIQVLNTSGAIQLVKVSATPTDNAAFTAAVNITGTVTNAPFYLVTTQLLEINNSGLVFPFPYSTIRATSNNTYTTLQYFTQTISASNTITLNTGNANFTFASGALSENYFIIDASNGNAISPTSVVASGSAVTITLGTTYTTTFLVAAAVTKTGTANTRKIKVLTFGATATFVTQAAATASVLSLGKSDCYRINSVKMAPAVAFGSTPTAGQYTVDITDRYFFDDGQRDSFYDYGTLTLQPSSPPPTNPIQVTFEYFTHGAGDYCDVGSYLDVTSNIDYKSIPSFKGISLRNVMDYRPKIDDVAPTLRIPKRGYDVTSDFSYYLARKDAIAIDLRGNFFDIKGPDSLVPGEPQDPTLGMVLYKISFEPYTFGTSNGNIGILKIDNKRYTMRDIGKLEGRISNLEYYTSLSLLEQQTASMNITDSAGLNRFKNGFIVDNFSGQGVGDVASPDYMCSVDMQNGELRPFCTMANMNLVESISSSSSTATTDRAALGYKLYGDVITVRLDPTTPHVKMISQPYGSRTEFVNPFAVFTFFGDVKMNPSSDDWFETTRRPDIIQNVEGNYNTLYTMAEKAGVLGTVWNAWQTEWTGIPVNTYSMTVKRGFDSTNYGLGAGQWNSRYNFSAAQLAAIGGNATAYGQDGVGARVLTYKTTATQIGLSRTGINTSVVAKVDTQLVDDKVVSTAVIPYIRSRNVLVQSKGLKPNTRFYAFFDGVDVSAYCTPASKIVFSTAPTGTFDDTTNVGTDVFQQAARTISSDSQSCLNIGDVVYVSTRSSTTYTLSNSPATAVVVGKEYNPDTSVYSIFVANITGTFLNSDVITGTISAAVGTIGSITTNALGANLTTNLNGDLNLLFNIPNSNSVRFRTGTREFKLHDASTNTGAYTSRGRTGYEATGTLQTKQATFTATRNAEFVQNAVSDTKTITQSSTNLFSDTGWYDPLAETFMVNSSGGAFLSKVDLYFAAKDTKIPVSIEIREVVNGYPGKKVLPFSRVTLKPEQVSLSGTSVTVAADGISYPKYDTPTTFTFSSPVYVQDATEYCIVVMSDSNAYKVWISQMGDTIPDSTRTISEQPYAGVLFKSQNASTWTANQDQDLMFNIWRANFDTSANATVYFVNDKVPQDLLDTNPFQTVSGSTTVRVWHVNHGMPSGSLVTFFGASVFNNITIGTGTYTIANVDLDSYTITAGTTANATGFGGGSAAYATKNIQYDVAQPSLQVQSFSNTVSSFSIRTAAGKSVDGSQTPYTIDTVYSPCIINDNNYFSSPRMVVSNTNAANAGLAGNRSLTLLANISTSNAAISPIIDTHRTSMILVSNKINSPTEANTNVSPLDVTSIFTGATGAYSFSGSTITSTNAAIRGLMPSILVGSYITIASATTTANNGTFLVTGNTDNGTTGTVTLSGITFTSEAAAAGTSVSIRTLFFDEITPVGSSSFSKYVSKDIQLVNQSTYIRAMLSANIPSESDVLVYYKTAAAGTDLTKVNWTLLPASSTVTKVTVGDPAFYDINYSVTGLAQFDLMKIKIVLKSTNSSAIPRVKDLQIIACA